MAVSAPLEMVVGEGKGLAEKLRVGRLLEDGLSYKETFIIRSYKVGINKTATVETIDNLLQVFLFLLMNVLFSLVFFFFGFSVRICSGCVIDLLCFLRH